jgi:TolA-binding protein
MTIVDDEPTASSTESPTESPTLAPLNELVRSTVHAPSQQRLLRAFNATSARLEHKTARGRRLPPLPAVAGVMLAFVGAVLGTVLFLLPHGNETAPLTYTIRGGSVIEGGYLQRSRDDQLTLTFSEGSEVTFMPGSGGRLRSVDGEGAHVAVETGTASFDITPRAGAKWLVDVGPFLVRVQGTVFTVSWDVAREMFELRLQRGRVAVSGPVSSGDIVLRGGQRLVVDLRTAETRITEDNDNKGTVQALEEPRDAGVVPAPDLTDDGPVPAPPQSMQSPQPMQPMQSSRPRPSSERAEQQAHSWAEAVAAADWDRILHEAEAEGIQQTLALASAEDLLALADAARYRRRMDLAGDALLALRKRFPRSPRSIQAAYLLGRVCESNPSRISEALRWYDEYLAGAPHGPYASEALGRKMVLSGKLDQKALTRRLAEQYLGRFPNGTYAGSARALLQSE